MFSNVSGRVSPADVHTFHQFVKAYEINPESLVLIANKIPRSFTEAQRQKFVDKIRASSDKKVSFADQIGNSIPFLFLDDMGESTSITHASALKSKQELFAHIVNDRMPKHHEQRHKLEFKQEVISSLEAQLKVLDNTIVQQNKQIQVLQSQPAPVQYVHVQQHHDDDGNDCSVC
jgi:hypothetical protein